MWSISEFVQNKKTIRPYFEWQLSLQGGRSPGIDRSSSFSKYFKLYCRNTTLSGWRYFAESGRPLFERLLWTAIYVTTLSIMGIVVLNVYREYEESSVVTTMDSDNYPSSLVDFPGIAICTINRISYKSAAQLATRISNANVSRLTFNEILEMIRYLGNLYDSRLRAHRKYQRELDDLLRAYHKGNYDITEIMKNLTPPCSEILSNCFFNGMQHDCSKIFEFRKTQSGFCCTFNYARGSDDFVAAARKPAYRLTNLGPLNGLIVALTPFLDDYFYSVLPSTGWRITVFKPDDYPDSTSGGISDLLLSPLTRMSLRLDAVTLINSDYVPRIPISRRRCIFYSELDKLSSGYTYSDCILKCRLEDMWRTCGCISFFSPRWDGGPKRICNTADTDCLRKHKQKWMSILLEKIHLHETKTQLFENENRSSFLYCEGCYPSCDDVQYFHRSWSTELQRGLHILQPLRNVNVVDHSVLSIYFIQRTTVRLRQDVAYYWYEFLSDIGGICGLFIGFSFISLVEFIYFSVLSLLSPGLSVTAGTRKKLRKKKSATYSTLYWNEFLPRQEGKIRIKVKQRY